MKITYFVHGTTTDNEQHLATGWNDGELSEKGIQQSKELPSKLQDSDFEVVFCSDLKRAINSAELSFKGNYKIIHDKRLREANYGDWNGATASKFKNDMEKYIDTRFPNGENYKDVEKRMREFVDEMKLTYSHMAIVAHQAPQLALEVIAKGKTWQQAVAEDWRKVGAWQPGWTYEVK
ncbi:MAG: histidine phosphatase family protein [Patescibacteria group bacterium]|jgi:broad specificity phosphatase PhoE